IILFLGMLCVTVTLGAVGIGYIITVFFLQGDDKYFNLSVSLVAISLSTFARFPEISLKSAFFQQQALSNGNGQVKQWSNRGRQLDD
ncbi:MAG: hypothetical protein CUN57_02525, partial [Phototrophicales bacterium]